MFRGYTSTRTLITEAKSKAIEPWHVRMPHTMVTYRSELSTSKQQLFSNNSFTRLYWRMT